MANSAGMLKESIWRDKDFRAIPRTAQTTYGQLLSQKELDRAGIQPLQVSKWAKGCDEITESDVWTDLKVLEAARFVFYDEDTDELFVRSYMRQSDITRYPNILKNALRCAGMVASPKLRHELATELRRLRRAEAAKVADEIDPIEPSENPSDNGSETVVQTVPEPFNPSERVREPRGVGEGVGEVTSVGGWVGRSREREADTDTTGEPSNDPPPPRCPKHIGEPTDQPCRACGVARQTRAAWFSEQAQREGQARSESARSAAETRALAIANCAMCDEDGYRAGRLCSHDPDEDARRERGLAAARAAITKGSDE
ncbi:hypothetical protein [Williamsia soli]|uniref:hypothetical protein n=1 Tax=Williamsia soli TaxID=364929 RepID=UPI001F368129|nr:hypothetical protein [Williamsia soli]